MLLAGELREIAGPPFACEDLVRHAEILTGRSGADRKPEQRRDRNDVRAGDAAARTAKPDDPAATRDGNLARSRCERSLE
jgi:hypothetical protein